MQYWDEIIHTAMLGTSKKEPDNSKLPEAISAVAEKLQQGLAAEDRFLQTTALAYNFRQCSVAAQQALEVMITPATPETAPYCSNESMRLLTDIVNTSSNSLLQLWLQACQQRNQIVQPDIIPQLLDIAVKQKALHTSTATCCGNRGRWLSQFNPEWTSVADTNTATPEEVWQTGTLQQRIQVLQQLRNTDPATALTWLQATWTQEDAATKIALLAILENNISAADLPFLESLATEKGKKVKEAATTLIKLIPESAIVQSYWQVLQQSVYLKKEKALLGLSTKTKLVIQLPDNVDEAVYKSGIDKLSKNAKELSDDEYILQQLTEQVPPQGWEAHFEEDKEGIIQLLQKNNASFLLLAIGKAAIRFKDAAWAQAIIKADKYNRAYAAAIPLLPGSEQEVYAIELLAQEENTPHVIILALLAYPTEWSLALTRKILPVMMNDPWHFNEAFFNQNIHLLPVAIIPELTTWKPKAEWHQSYWQNIITHVAHLLQLKKEITTASGK